MTRLDDLDKFQLNCNTIHCVELECVWMEHEMLVIENLRKQKEMKRDWEQINNNNSTAVIRIINKNNLMYN